MARAWGAARLPGRPAASGARRCSAPAPPFGGRGAARHAPRLLPRRPAGCARHPQGRRGAALRRPALAPAGAAHAHDGPQRPGARRRPRGRRRRRAGPRRAGASHARRGREGGQAPLAAGDHEEAAAPALRRRRFHGPGLRLLAGQSGRGDQAREGQERLPRLERAQPPGLLRLAAASRRPDRRLQARRGRGPLRRQRRSGRHVRRPRPQGRHRRLAGGLRQAGRRGHGHPHQGRPPGLLGGQPDHEGRRLPRAYRDDEPHLRGRGREAPRRHLRQHVGGAGRREGRLRGVPAGRERRP